MADEINQPADGAQEGDGDTGGKAEKAPKSKVYSVRLKTELARRLDEAAEPHGGHTPVITQLVERWIADGAPFPPERPAAPVIDLDALVTHVVEAVDSRVSDSVVTHMQELAVFVLQVRSFERPLSEEEARLIVAEAYLADAMRAIKRKEGRSNG